MTNTIEQDRKDFEALAKPAFKQPFDNKRDGEGYADGYLDSAWWGFQASAQLQRERQAQPTPNQSEPAAKVYSHDGTGGYDIEYYKSLPIPCLLYTAPQPTSQVLDALNRIRWRCEVERDGYDAPRGGWDLKDPQHANYAGYQDACNEIINAIDAAIKESK